MYAELRVDVVEDIVVAATRYTRKRTLRARQNSQIHALASVANILFRETTMTLTAEQLAKRILRAEWDRLSAHEREVIQEVLRRVDQPRDVNREYTVQRTFGERAADAIGSFGGSWTFVILFGIGLLLWATLNTEILGPMHLAFDPYPYIFLNLVLSMLAAIQAPIIMMSQNRQGTRDRLEAEIDHEVNVRAELAIRNVEQHLHVLETQLHDLKSLIQANSTSA